LGTKRYGINTTHVTHNGRVIADPGASMKNAEVPCLLEQKRVQLSWLFVAGII
jgi:hypothetical protein